MKPHDDKLIWEALQEGGMRQPARLDRARVNEGDDAIRLKMAVAEVAGALGSGRISLKSYDRDAGTLVVSTGGDKSIILKAVGFEGDHDIPISQRPDKRAERKVQDDFIKALNDPKEFDPSRYD